MSQTVGHLDFFPNGGIDMPGCQKNILSQIVDIDGIWEGKTIVCMRGFSWEKICVVSSSFLLNVLSMLTLYRTHIFYDKGLLIVSPRYGVFHWGKWHEGRL